MAASEQISVNTVKEKIAEIDGKIDDLNRQRDSLMIQRKAFLSLIPSTQNVPTAKNNNTGDQTKDVNQAKPEGPREAVIGFMRTNPGLTQPATIAAVKNTFESNSNDRVQLVRTSIARLISKKILRRDEQGNLWPGELFPAS